MTQPIYISEIKSQLARIEEKQIACDKKISEIHTILYSDVDPEIGLIHRFLIVEDAVDNVRKLSIGAIAATITGVIGYILSVIF